MEGGKGPKQLRGFAKTSPQDMDKDNSEYIDFPELSGMGDQRFLRRKGNSACRCPSQTPDKPL